MNQISLGMETLKLCLNTGGRSIKTKLSSCYRGFYVGPGVEEILVARPRLDLSTIDSSLSIVITPNRFPFSVILTIHSAHVKRYVPDRTENRHGLVKVLPLSAESMESFPLRSSRTQSTASSGTINDGSRF